MSHGKQYSLVSGAHSDKAQALCELFERIDATHQYRYESDGMGGFWKICQVESDSKVQIVIVVDEAADEFAFNLTDPDGYIVSEYGGLANVVKEFGGRYGRRQIRIAENPLGEFNYRCYDVFDDHEWIGHFTKHSDRKLRARRVIKICTKSSDYLDCQHH